MQQDSLNLRMTTHFQFSIDNLTAPTRPMSIFARTFGQFAIWLSLSLTATKSSLSLASGNAHRASIFLHQESPSAHRRAVTALPSIMAFRWDNQHRKRDKHYISSILCPKYSLFSFLSLQLYGLVLRQELGTPVLPEARQRYW